MVTTSFPVGLSRPQTRSRPSMLVELGLVEQRDQAVLEVLSDGAAVTDVARRYGWPASRSTSGSAPTRRRPRANGPIGRRSPCRARIRWTRSSRPGSSDAPRAPRLGLAHDPPLARARGRRPAAGPHLGGPLSSAPSARQLPAPPAQARQLQRAGILERSRWSRMLADIGLLVRWASPIRVTTVRAVPTMSSGSGGSSGCGPRRLWEDVPRLRSTRGL